MKIYYEILDSDDDLQNEMMRLLYENFKLNLMWKLRSLESQIKAQNGIIFIDRIYEHRPPVLRFEGFPNELENMIKIILNNNN
jgi:hypothetical protein